ncbi:MAG: GldG family protein [Planctomycetota bacterium]
MTAPAPAPHWGTKARFGVASAVGLQLLLLAGIIVAANWISTRRYRRWDWTDDVTYTLGDGTKQLLGKISAEDKKYQIVAFYLPDEDGAWESALKRTQDLLEEYRTRSRDRIEWEIVSVASVGGGGVQAAQKKHDLRSQIGANDVVFKRGETERVVNLREFFGQQWDDMGPRGVPKLTSFNGEAIVTSTLKVLSQDKPIVLAFTTGHEEVSTEDMQGPAEWGAFSNGLLRQREGYSVRTLSLPPGASVPQDASVLVIAGPKRDFNEGELTSVQVFLARGGRLLVTLDSGPEMSDRPLPNLYKFLGGMGITPQTLMVLDPDNSPEQLVQVPGGFQRKKDIGTFFLSGFDRKHPVTGKFDADKNVAMLGACALFLEKDAVPEGLTLTELARCGSDGWGEKDYPRDQKMTPDRDEPGPLTVAAAVSGRLKGSTVEDEMRLVVIGDTTGQANGIQKELRSPDLVLNSIRWLAKQEYLIGVDPKVPEDRSLILTPKQDDYVFRVCVILLPSLAIAFGLTMFMTRRSA